jgi:hypothetical protein
MRTTLTLDDDVAKQLREKSRRSGETFKEVVNETLRRGLRSGEKPSPPLPRFVVESKARGFCAGVDILHLNRFYDELEVEEFLRKEADRRTER